MEWALELFLVGMLGVTLFHAVRLERALGVLKRDRAELEELVESFNSSTRQAEQGVERLRQATDGAGKQIARQIDAALALKDDMTFLLERSERSADKLDRLVRSARPLTSEPARSAVSDAPRRSVSDAPQRTDAPRRPASDAPQRTASDSPQRTASEPFLRPTSDTSERSESVQRLARAADPESPTADQRVRSQAERDLLKALRLAR